MRAFVPFSVDCFRARSAWTFVILPLALALTVSWLSLRHGPHWMQSTTDPDYAYLFNSLSLAVSRPVGNSDHPGTTLQELGALAIRLRHPRASSPQLLEQVLGNPEGHLRLVQLFLLGGYVLAIAGVSIILFLSTGSVELALLAQLTPFFSSTLLTQMIRVSPEPLLEILALALIGGLALAYAPAPWSAGEARSPWLRSTVPAILCGLGIVTKITFAPLLLAPLLLVPGWRQRARLLCETLAVSILALWPVRDRIPLTLHWFRSLLLHRGRYGSGPLGFVDHRLFPFLGELITTEPGFCLFVLLCSVGVLALRAQGGKRRRESPWERKLLEALLLAQWAQFVMVIKHPEVRYLTPGISLCGFEAGLLLRLWRRSYPGSFPAWKVGVGTVLGCLFTFPSLIGFVHTSDAALADNREIEALVRGNEGHCTVVEFYGACTQTYALGFALAEGGWSFGPELQRRYGSHLFWEYFQRYLYSWGGSLPISPHHAPGTCFLLRGLPLEAMLGIIPPWLEVRRLYQKNHQSGESLYEATYRRANTGEPGKRAAAIRALEGGLARGGR